VPVQFAPNLNLRLGRSHEMTPSSSGCPVRRCSPPGAPSLRPCIQNTLLASRCLRRSVQIEPWAGGGKPRPGGYRASEPFGMPPTCCGAPKIFPHLEVETSLKLPSRGILTEERPLTSKVRLARTRCRIFSNQNKPQHECS